LYQVYADIYVYKYRIYLHTSVYHVFVYKYILSSGMKCVLVFVYHIFVYEYILSSSMKCVFIFVHHIFVYKYILCSGIKCVHTLVKRHVIVLVRCFNYAYLCACLHMYAYVCICVHICACVCMCIPMYRYVCICMYALNLFLYLGVHMHTSNGVYIQVYV
jgi:hypothetical protein